MSKTAARIAVIGAGWAGCAAAVRAVQMGAQVSLFEASRTPGGRGRSVSCPDVPGGQLDNGQHILLGAYTDILALMRTIGADPQKLLQRLPLDWRSLDGNGLRLSGKGPAFLDALRAIACARGWSASEKWRLLRAAAHWRLQGFVCPQGHSVADVCRALGPQVQRDLIEPLCISAFNSVPSQTSGAVFLRVLRDALFSVRGASDVLIAHVPFGRLLPEPALAWLQAHQANVVLGCRVQTLRRTATEWLLQGSQNFGWLAFDHVILACPAWEASRLVREAALSAQEPAAIQRWALQAGALQHAPIATLYAWCPAKACANLPPMQALTCSSREEAQFVFHHPQWQRRQDNGTLQTLLAFVASHCSDSRPALEEAIFQQARKQLNLAQLQPVRTIIERRATFVCHAGLQRPALHIAEGLLACGDYVEGPYPATLEGAVRSGLQAASACLMPGK